MSKCCGTKPNCKTVKKCCNEKEVTYKIYSRWGKKKCVPTHVYGRRNFVCRLDRRVQLGQGPKTCCY